MPADGNQYLEACLALLTEKLERVEHLVSTGELPDITIESVTVDHAVKNRGAESALLAKFLADDEF